MAPARKKSRKLGLEEEAAGGGGQTVSSSEEENKKLYVFVMHHSGNYPYSLFALDIPSPGTVVKTVVTPPSYETVKGVEHKIPSRTEPERSQVRPILRFPHGKGWGRFMKCIRLGQKLYFLGGHSFEGRPRTYPREVRALDLSQGVESRHRDRADKVVVQVASMNTGKAGTIVYFVADGKIFLVAGRKKEGQVVPFEIFDQGVWKIGAAPPFDDAHIFPPLVVGRKAFFCGQMVGMRHFSCCYMIDDETWIDYITSKKDVNVSFLGFGGGFSCTPADLRLMVDTGVAGGVAIGETLWNVVVVEANNVPAVVRFDISKKQANKKYYKSGLMYYIQHHPSAADEDDLIDYGPGTFLTRLALDSRHLLFLQVEKSGVDRIRMSIILFDTPAGDRRESPKYLTSAHYFVKLDPSNPTYTLMDAHIGE